MKSSSLPSRQARFGASVIPWVPATPPPWRHCEIRREAEMRCDSEISFRALFREINALRAAMRVSLVACPNRAFGGGKTFSTL
jgi:hypothetical protein